MDDFVVFAKNCLYIRTKAGDIKPLELNKAQLYIHKRLEEQRLATGKVRALLLKGRQQGASTYTEARFLWRTMFSNGRRCFILTHQNDATKNLFNMAKLYIDKLPKEIQPVIGTDSSNELVFTHRNASYKVGTAGNKGVGRSETIQLLHGSEVAFWRHADEHAKGILQAVPDELNTEIIMESTANGANGWFYQQCQAAMRGEGEYMLIFVPWFWQEEYRFKCNKDFAPTNEELMLMKLYGIDKEQLNFRRNKIVQLGSNGADGNLAFKQEYPCTPEEAFLQSDGNSLIPGNLIQRAMKSSLKEGYGKIIIGVDPARFGDDRTAITIRKGRFIIRIMVNPKMDLMALTGVIVRLIKMYSPFLVNMDKGGLGVGVLDRLHELGYTTVNGVDFGGRASQADRYFNKRAEIWAKMKLWLDDEPCMLPSRDDLLSDLTAPRYSFDSNGRLKLESKEDMKKRGCRSPDLGDSLALTFAEEVSLFEEDEDHDMAYAPTDSRIGI